LDQEEQGIENAIKKYRVYLESCSMNRQKTEKPMKKRRKRRKKSI